MWYSERSQADVSVWPLSGICGTDSMRSAAVYPGCDDLADGRRRTTIPSGRRPFVPHFQGTRSGAAVALDQHLAQLLTSLNEAITESLSDSAAVQNGLGAMEDLGHPITIFVEIVAPIRLDKTIVTTVRLDRPHA